MVGNFYIEFLDMKNMCCQFVTAFLIGKFVMTKFM